MSTTPNDTDLDIERRSALQQPQWMDDALLRRVRHELSNWPALVDAGDVGTLRAMLAEVASGHAQVVQAGDCAEDPADCTRASMARKSGLLDLLAGAMKMNTHRPVVRAGRIAGQFAKPRSKPFEWVSDQELPTYRGYMVNTPEPDPDGRQPDPERLLSGYRLASEMMDHLGWRVPSQGIDVESPLWTSHEALLLDYEIPLLRKDSRGRQLLGSTHWPWVGERTRHADGAHAALLAEVANPVACKIGPDTTTDEVLALCQRLDPHRQPGRLTFIIRMGAERVAERLPALVSAVRSEGHPVVWLTDPMHANTSSTPDGLKTRFVDAVLREVHNFEAAIESAGGTAGGLHLETTPEDVTECVATEAEVDQVGGKYTSFCDPRLNPHQALSVVSAWNGSGVQGDVRHG